MLALIARPSPSRLVPSVRAGSSYYPRGTGGPPPWDHQPASVGPSTCTFVIPPAQNHQRRSDTPSSGADRVRRPGGQWQLAAPRHIRRPVAHIRSRAPGSPQDGTARRDRRRTTRRGARRRDFCPVCTGPATLRDPVRLRRGGDECGNGAEASGPESGTETLSNVVLQKR